MNKKSFGALALTALAVVALASCGPKAASTSSTNNPASATGTSASASVSSSTDKKTPTLSFSTSYTLDKVYDGTAVAVPTKGTDFTTNGDGAVSIEWYAGTAKIAAAPKDAGNYTLKVILAESATYIGASITKDFAITKATGALTWVNPILNYNKEEDGAALSVSPSDFSFDHTVYAPKGIEVVYEVYNGTSFETLTAAPSKAGYYRVYGSIAGTGNSEAVVSTKKEVTIFHNYVADLANSTAPTESTPGSLVIRCKYYDMIAFSIPLRVDGSNSKGAAYYKKTTTAALCETDGAVTYTVTSALADEIDARVGVNHFGATGPGAKIVDSLTAAYKTVTKVLPKLHHDMSYTLVTAPTGTTAGAYHGVCKNDTSHTVDGVLLAGTLPTYTINDAKTKVTASYAIAADAANDYNAGTATTEITQWTIAVDPNGGGYRSDATASFSTSLVSKTVSVSSVGEDDLDMGASFINAPTGMHLGAVKLYVDDVEIADSRDSSTIGQDYRFDAGFSIGTTLSTADVKYGNVTGDSSAAINLFGNMRVKLIWANNISVVDFTSTVGSYSAVDTVEAFGGESKLSDLSVDLANSSSDISPLSRVTYKVLYNVLGGPGNFETWMTYDANGNGTLASDSQTVGYFDANNLWVARNATTTLYRFVTTKIATASTRVYDDAGNLDTTLSTVAAQAADSFTPSLMTRAQTVNISALTTYFTSPEEIDNIYLDEALTKPLFSSIATPTAATLTKSLTYNDVDYTDGDGHWCYLGDDNVPLYIKLAASV